MTATREQSLLTAAEALVAAAVRIETEKAIAASCGETPELEAVA